MAAVNPTGPDTLITIKVALDGVNRRFKLPLRDLGANVLPQKLCSLLDISSPADVVFQRYSDSAASFITLDPSNPSVYKQLYRAAKAKLKLRIKATLVSSQNRDAQEQSTPAQADAEPSARDQVNTVLCWAQSGQEWQTSPPGAPPPAPSNNSRGSCPPAADRSLDDRTHERPSPADEPVCRTHLSNAQARHQYNQFLRAVSPLTKNENLAGGSSPTPFPTRQSLTNGLARLGANSGLPAETIDDQTSNGLQLPGPSYSVYCNSCDAPIPDAHYHCSICDDGDFDLCQTCVDSGELCSGSDHWLIKRFVHNGRVINSTTETIAPRTPIRDEPADDTVCGVKSEDTVELEQDQALALLTCNCCVEVHPVTKFVSCTTCEDFDLCIPCHVNLKHGHHPGHTFRPATTGVTLDGHAAALCPAGRNMIHYAFCDGCDKTINGVRHKCLNCPDWDYCSACFQHAPYLHPGHRFAPVYEPIPLAFPRCQKHFGVFCDGPLCKGKGGRNFIKGERFKCAVCHDTDFCANCEASPNNRHNRTHPLIKFKTPVKNVSVLTVGEKDSGEAMPSMGDYHARTRSAATETHPPVPSSNAATQVQIVADLKPTKDASTSENKEPQQPRSPTSKELNASFVRDSVPDGTKLQPNHVFTQTWTLTNSGAATWPQGCSVKFVGGDNMRNVDPAHPSSVADFEKSVESNVVEGAGVPAGQSFDFGVTMRTPSREGKCISYWRLTAPNGEKFGHRLWCDIDVSKQAVVTASKVEQAEDGADVSKPTDETESSTMIFPTLEKESPVSSTHEAAPSASATQEAEVEDDEDLVSEVASLALEDEDTDEGFCTDEEYDILDASDEEYLANAHKDAQK